MLKTQSCDHVQYLHNYQFHNMHNLLNLEFLNHSSSNWEFHPAHSTKHNPSMHLLWKCYQKRSSYLNIQRKFWNSPEQLWWIVCWQSVEIDINATICSISTSYVISSLKQPASWQPVLSSKYKFLTNFDKNYMIWNF